MNAAVTHPGFAEPVADAQATFRAVLAAMARPGSLHRAGADLAPPPPLGPAAASCLLTLVDNEVSLWLDTAAMSAADWIAFHCGARPALRPEQAAYALALAWPGFQQFAVGTDDAPQDGATLIVQIDRLGEGDAWRLAGPGLREPCELRTRGLPRDFAAQWADNRQGFPLGVDLILCAGDTLAALPRSVSVEAC